MDLNLMAVFDALMRERSVSRAADRLGLGQPATSAALARLRALFDDELFIRGPGGVTPTSRATAAYPAVSSALETLRRVVEPASTFDPASASCTFRISGGDYAAMTLLPQLYGTIRRLAPDVDLRFRFVEKDRVPDLLATGELDLALGVFPRPAKTLQRQPLMRERFVCLLRADHPDQGRKKLTLDLFCRLTHILVTERGDETGAVDAALGKLGRSRRVALTVPHLLTVPVLVAGSDSIATIGERPARICTQAFRHLVALDPPLPLAGWELSQMWARRRSGDAALRWFRETLHRVAQTQPMPPAPA